MMTGVPKASCSPNDDGVPKASLVPNDDEVPKASLTSNDNGGAEGIALVE